MTDLIQISIAVSLWVIVALLTSGRLRGPQGPIGTTGERGEQGPQGEQGETGHIHVSNSSPTHGQRFEMLKGDLSTGHFVCEGSADFDEALNTPGLRLRAPDGSITEGVQ